MATVLQTKSSSSMLQTESSSMALQTESSSMAIQTKSSSVIRTPEAETPRTKAKAKKKSLAASRWATVLRWIPTSTDHIIAAEKRLLSLVKYVHFLTF